MIGGNLKLDDVMRVAYLTLSDDDDGSIDVPMIVDPTFKAAYSDAAAAAAWQRYRNDVPGPIVVDGVLTTDANGFHYIHLK